VLRRLAFALALATLAGPALAAPARGPLAEFRQSYDRLDKLLRKPAAPGSAEERRLQGEIKQAVNAFLDYRELARRSLAAHWEKLTPAQQGEFVTVFQDLIERNYVKQIRGNLDYRVDFLGEEVKDGDAAVHTVVRARRKGRAADTTIDYRFHRAGDGRWMAYDLITDDVSLLRNYRSQFNRIITREGYPSLLSKMKKKLEETPA
jgi:phospholipid transport system substrate-binding protein